MRATPRYAGSVSLASSGLALGLHITPIDGVFLLYDLFDLAQARRDRRTGTIESAVADLSPVHGIPH